MRSSLFAAEMFMVVFLFHYNLFDDIIIKFMPIVAEHLFLTEIKKIFSFLMKTFCSHDTTINSLQIKQLN